MSGYDFSELLQDVPHLSIDSEENPKALAVLKSASLK